MEIFKNTWALLLGVTLLFFGAGMLSTLVVVRGTQEGFSPGSIGLMQSSYQVGWLIAALLIPRFIRSVGHIRVFAALASLGSGMILTHLLHINAWSWSAQRLVMGICTAGLMIVAESWLNEMSDNRSRGKTLAIYTILSWGAPVVGVYILQFGDIGSSFFFLAASIILSVGAIPILLSVTRGPELIEVEHFNMMKLYRIAPVAVTGVIFTGFIHGAFFFTVAIYALAAGLDVKQTTTISAVALGTGIIFQWPIAMLSDRFDRRLVLLATALLAGIPALLFGLGGELSTQKMFMGVACFSGMALSFYSQCIAHANDYLKPHQIVSATATLVLIYGTGMAISPFITSILIAVTPSFFFWVNGLLSLVFAAYVLYRIARRKALDDQGEMIPVTTVSPYSSVISAAEEWHEEEDTSKNPN